MTTEQKAQHTAGPWKQRDDYAFHVFAPDGKGAERVVASCTPDIASREGVLRVQDHHECDANARLIAAAPIGYELAEAVTDSNILSRFYSDNETDDDSDQGEHILKLAECFLAVARGEEE